MTGLRLTVDELMDLTTIRECPQCHRDHAPARSCSEMSESVEV